MIPVPKLDDVRVAFGETAHMPPFNSIPKEFNVRGNKYAAAISTWFFSGAKNPGNGLVIGDAHFVAKSGVPAIDAVRAIRAILVSYEPKHEHKIAACAYLLSEWFNCLDSSKGSRK